MVRRYLLLTTAGNVLCSSRVLTFAPGRNQMLMALFLILVVMWAMGFFAFHVAGGLIHLLLIFALISLVMHLFTGRTV
jgi:hypothetical protein